MKNLLKIAKCQKGQSIVELALTMPLLLVLGLGTIEISNMIHSYIVLTHLTREGANLISRGTNANQGGLNCNAPDDALDAIITGAGPVIQCSTPAQWRVIYTKVGPAEPDLCKAAPNPGNSGNCHYVVHEYAVRGSGNVDSSKVVCPSCDLTAADFVCAPVSLSCPEPANIPGIGSINPGQTLYAVEVFYGYDPITPVANFGVNLSSSLFYDRAIF